MNILRTIILILLTGFALHGGCASTNQLTFKVDDYIRSLYINNVLISNLLDFPSINQVPLDADNNNVFVAFQAQNSNGPCGILLSDTSGLIKTDATWKCSNTYTDRWMYTEFDDSRWPAATLIQVNRFGWSGNPTVSTINPNAWWIWAANQGANATTYCRMKYQIRNIYRKLPPSSVLTSTTKQCLKKANMKACVVHCNLDHSRCDSFEFTASTGTCYMVAPFGNHTRSARQGSDVWIRY